ncbi:MAG: hypothetical protein L6V80_02260 [Bacteroidales bacterium]|nr:MAG: hypothetical protein L6V80_02260 [Bacteroidales bacterium]
MAVFKVEGGTRLHGELRPQGAKNEALEILCATLLTPERVVVHNVPQIIDVMQLIEPARGNGRRGRAPRRRLLPFRAADINLDYLRSEGLPPPLPPSARLGHDDRPPAGTFRCRIHTQTRR